MNITRLLPAILLLAAGFFAAEAGAAELKVVSATEMKGALEELAKDFEKSSGHKLKVEYVAVDVVEKRMSEDEEIDVAILTKPGMDKLAKGVPPKIVGNTQKVLTQKGPDQVYVAASSFWALEPIAAKAFIDFLAGQKAKEVYKAKGLSS
jgi:molybdate transport system substrate-binding protein